MKFGTFVTSTLCAFAITISGVVGLFPANAQSASKKTMTTSPKVQNVMTKPASAAMTMSKFEFLLKFSGMDEALKYGGPYTVLVPEEKLLTNLPGDATKEQVAAVLKAHIFNGAVHSSSLTNGQVLYNALGNPVTVEKTDKGIVLKDNKSGVNAVVTAPDIKTSYGIQHTINSIFIAKPSQMTKFQELLKLTGLDEALKYGRPYTVLQPSEEALKSVPANASKDDIANVLKAHIFQGTYGSSSLTNGQVLYNSLGKAVRVNIVNGSVFFTDRASGVKAKVTNANVSTDFGLIHQIDSVFFGTAPKPQPNSTAKFDELLKLTGLDTALSYAGPYTVLAPTDKALSVIPAHATKEQIAEVLKNHVFQGTVKAADLKDGQTLYNALGGAVKVSVSGGTVMFTDVTSGAKATVVEADKTASYGTIHKINGVLNP
ncbi:MAG: fasciclin domain-containing protein [Patescibacteria group bacterium]